MGAVKLGSSSLREIAALLRLLRLGSPDLGAADENPVAVAMSLD
jgi:hypothetical protein